MIEVAVRAMSSEDLNFAAACTASEGWWGETREVFEGFHSHDPGGCFMAVADGERIGICVATGYGAVGFVGELIVVPEMRGRGVGRQLLDRAVAYLRSRGAESVYLDGVAAAVPLYERAGFRKVCRSLRFSGRVAGRAHADVRRMGRADLEAVAALDRRAFGADRRFFLERRLARHPALCQVLVQGGRVMGFVLGRRVGDTVSAGPWVVGPGEDRPLELLEGLALEAGGGAISLGVLEANAQAAAMVRALGMAERADPPWRMVLGPAGEVGEASLVWAIGSPAKG